MSQRGSHESHFPDGEASRSGVYPGSSIDPEPDYVRQAEGWGARGDVIDDPADISPAVEDGLGHMNSGRAVVLDVVLEGGSPRDEIEPPT